LIVRALAAVLLVGCSVPEGEYFGRVPEPDPTHLRWCNVAEPEYLDPALAVSTADLRVLYELFDGLTTFDENASPKPSLAERWEISDDLRRFTFHLRRDARWSNGRPITSADFVYSLARVLHPLTASANAETLWRIRHGKPYSAGTARLVLADGGGFRAGEAVAVEPEAPPTNLRRARGALELVSSPGGGEVWGRVPGGSELTIVELDPTRAWAYVFFAEDDGLYGWAPLAALDAPHADRVYAVTGLDRPAKGELRGRDLLMLPELLGVRAPDPHTLVLETEGPTPFLLDLSLGRAFRPVPREAVSRHPKRWVRPGNIVTSGPFHLTFWRERDRFELARSPTFWGARSVRLERVTIYSMSEQSANVNVYFQGGCDALASNGVPPSMLPALAGKKDYTAAAYLGSYFYLLNVERLPSVHLRRALSHALDRTSLPRLLKGGQIPSVSLTPGKPIATLTDGELALCGVTRDTPGVAMIVETGKHCYVPPRGAAFDPEAARRELELARAELGARFPRVVTVRFNTGFEQHKTIAEWVQNEWKRVLGLDVELESMEWKTYLKATLAREYDAARYGVVGNFADPEAEFLPQFKCASPDNRTGFCSAELDRLMAEAADERDRGARLALTRRAEAVLLEEMPILPLFVYTQHVLTRPYVRGLHVNLADHQSLRETWIDPDWRRAGR
jgi:oligopeptide transport system substrate-binding protein